ncbi:MAG: rRNA maturation RNase YbeY [Candidatus Woykebacteria bacterium RBG_13_40_15]|uniref:Endoribonuclease YbeY n=1 Tax=Candidatus Woykebacteria bacterium RBG_13_40_15 TaxID=1802593 RepID=A0A1G1W666_9BACT|nr:MAG: rRNA maturation RNase YbeY [Candidatus Woykebacteria bacterium RBG_13_40_15]
MNYKVVAYVEPHYPIKKSVLVVAAEATLSAENVKGKVSLVISVIGDRKMRELNKKYLNLDKPTDVLSFAYSLDTGKPKTFVTPPSSYLNLGDILISYPQLLDRAAKEDIMVDDMARILVIHGVLHLLGFDHENPHDAAEMERLEDTIFSKTTS